MIYYQYKIIIQIQKVEKNDAYYDTEATKSSIYTQIHRKKDKKRHSSKKAHTHTHVNVCVCVMLIRTII